MGWNNLAVLSGFIADEMSGRLDMMGSQRIKWIVALVLEHDILWPVQHLYFSWFSDTHCSYILRADS